MPRILVYDTETTGLPLFDQPSDDPRQPHIVELAAGLYDAETGERIDLLHAIVRPNGWTIPDEVARIHGITTERALAEGRAEDEVFGEFVALWRRADLRVAHNESFDARIVRIACKRFLGDGLADEWKAGKAECTARLSTPIINLPPTGKMMAAGFRKPKTPNLTECIRHFFSEAHDGAHGALADMEGCARVYFYLKAKATSASAPPTTVAAKPAPAIVDEIGF